MRAPRNMGADYIETFDGIYPYLAKHHGMLLYPFFLDGVIGVAKLNQSDGIHPTAQGIAVIVERILPTVERLIRRVRPAES